MDENLRTPSGPYPPPERLPESPLLFSGSISTPLDPEVAAINAVLQAIAPLPHDGRSRVLNFVMGKAVNPFLRDRIEQRAGGGS